MKFYNIGNACDPQFVGAETDGTDDTDVTTRLCDAAVSFLVENSSLRRKAVILPLLFDMKERKPPRAMDILPHGGQGKQLFFCVQALSPLLHG